MKNAISVAEINALEKLVHEGLDGDRVESSAVALCIHVFLQVLVHVIEDEHEFVFGVDDIVEADNVLVLQFLHKGDLADRGGGCAFFGVEVDFLESYKLAGLTISTFEDLGKSVKWW